MNNYEQQMKNIFNIGNFPDYPSTGNPQKDAKEFAEQFQKVSMLRNDPVYYSGQSTGVVMPDFLSHQCK